jgi:hypothetical protein
MFTRSTALTVSQLPTLHRVLLQKALQLHWETKTLIKLLEADDKSVSEVEIDPEEENSLIRIKYTIELV